MTDTARVTAKPGTNDPRTVAFAVDGMSCASCVNRIERFLRKVDGVEEAHVNLATERATVRAVPDVTAQQLVEAIEAAGYDATLLTDAGEPRAGHDRTPSAAAEPASDTRVARRDRAQRPHETSVSNSVERMRHLRRRLIVAAVLTTPLLLGLLRMTVAPGLPELLSNPWLQLALATPVQLYAAWPFYRGAWRVGRHGTADMNTLVALGTSAAFGYSLAAVVRPDFFRAAGVAGAPPLYFDTAAVIVTLVLLGRYLEARARGRASDQMRALVQLVPKSARVVVDATEREIAVADLQPGTVVLVRQGERVPTDGRVVRGSASVDESMLTGESIPIPKQEGDEVIGGTINVAGAFEMRTTRVGRDTVLAGIVRLVEEAQGSRAPIQRVADAVTGYFVPLVLGVAVLTFVAWLVLGPQPSFNHALLNAVAVLIVACPCALGLATPTSIIVGIGKGAEVGVVFRSAEALERLQRVTTVVLDKTGTVTQGRPTVTDIVRAPGAPEEPMLLKLVASAERGSAHPLADAIMRAGAERGSEPGEADAFEQIAGEGVSARVGAKRVVVGNARMMHRLLIATDAVPLGTEARTLNDEGKTVMFVALDGQLVGLLAIADTPRPEAASAVSAVRRLGVDVVMLTGDGERAARGIARQAGIGTVLADVRPDEKQAQVRRLQAAGHTVAMVGDGINDAPALAAADVGIAMGSGTDVAIEAAPVTLLRPDLRRVAVAIGLSRATMRNIRQNLFWAFAYNVALIPLAAGLLYPVTGVLLDPILAAGAMALSSVTVVTNALRLKRFEPYSESPPLAHADSLTPARA